MASPPIDLDSEKSTEKVKNLLKLKKMSMGTVIKIKIFESSLLEIIFHIISLILIVPYVYLLAQGVAPIEIYDTIVKLLIGAYIGNIVKKN